MDILKRNYLTNKKLFSEIAVNTKNEKMVSGSESPLQQ
jgi:hypothetical protein